MLEYVRTRVEGGRMVGPLWVEESGAGRPLLLLHGNGQTGRSFRRLLPLLAPGRRLVVVDSRGHGRSPRGDGPLTIARMADDVAQVVGLLGHGPVDVLGFSDGGNVGLELVVRHPERVRSLVTSGANLDPSGITWFGTWTMLAAYRILLAARRVVPALAGYVERFELMVHDPHIPVAALAHVPVPVLVVAGQWDDIRREHTDLVTASLPDAREAIVPFAWHAVPQQRPAALARLVDAFHADLGTS